MSAKLACLFGAVMLVWANVAHAIYDANMTGQIEGYIAYAEYDYVFFRLKNQPTSHNGCNPFYFVIPGTVPMDRRKMMVARLTVAYALQEQINIGYSANGDCANGYIQIYRIG